MRGVETLEVAALSMGEFTFAGGEEYAGQTGVVVAYAVRHRGGVRRRGRARGRQHRA